MNPSSHCVPGETTKLIFFTPVLVLSISSSLALTTITTTTTPCSLSPRFSNMAYRLANAHLSGYGSSYPYNPRMSGYAQQQDLYSDPPDLQASLTPLPGDDFMGPHFRPMQSVAPASFGPPGQPRSAQAPCFRSQSQSQSQSQQQPLIISPSTRRISSGPLERLLKNDCPDNLDLIDLSDGGNSIEKLVLPSEMPIGSLVHFQRPQKWGVVRVANVRIREPRPLLKLLFWYNAWLALIVSMPDPILHHEAGNCPIPWAAGLPYWPR